MNYERATLKKKDPRDWYVYYSYRNPSTGYLQPFKIRDGINKKSYRKDPKKREEFGLTIAEGINLKIDNGWSPFNNNKEKNLLEWLEIYAEDKKATLEETTYGTYVNHHNMLREYIKKHGLNNISPKQFTPVMAKEISSQITKNGKASYHNTHVQIMRAFFSHLVEMEVINRNPYKNVRKERVPKGGYTILTMKERAELKKYAENNDLGIVRVILTVFYTGIRPKELTFIQIKHINTDRTRIVITADSAKSDQQRTAEVPKAFVKQLKEWCQGQADDYYLFSRGQMPGSEKQSRQALTIAFKKLREKLGWDFAKKLYGTKHTMAGVFMEAGGDIMTLMRQLGHKHPKQTMTYVDATGYTPTSNFTEKQPKF